MGNYGYTPPPHPQNSQNDPNDPNNPPAPDAQRGQPAPQQVPAQGAPPPQYPQAPYAPAGQPAPQQQRPAYPAQQPFTPVRQAGAQPGPTATPPAYPGSPAYPQQTPQPAQGGQTPQYPPLPQYPAQRAPGAPSPMQGQPVYPPYQPYAPPTPSGQPMGYPGGQGAQAPIYSPPAPGAQGIQGGYTAPPLVTGAPQGAYQPFQPPKPPAPPKRPMGRGGAFFAGAAALALVILLIAGALIYSLVGTIAYQIGPLVIGPHEQISGVVYGQDPAERINGYTKTKPIAATVTCGSVSAHTNASGAYSLSLPAATTYTCSVSGASYVTTKLILGGHGAQPLTLNFGADSLAQTCPAQTQSQSVACAALTLQPATLTGAVTDAATGQGLSDANVSCWNDDAALATSQQTAQTFSTTANGNGVYTLKNLPPDHYACVGYSSGALHRFTLTAGQTMRLNFPVCTSGCPGATYHQGAVMHTATIYIDFWLPKGQNYQPNGNNARFESLVKQYASDVGGTPFYHLLTQYWDTSGPVRDNMRFGGSYVDTTPYPHAGTPSDPITDDEVQASAARAIAANHWQDDHQSDEVFVLTGYNIEECAGNACTYPDSNGNGFCGYHDTANSGTIYAFISDIQYQFVGNYVYSCVPKTFGQYGPTAQGPIPYGDAYADQVINTLSHEQFESVSDPIGAGGWYKGDTDGEIGDVCRDTFGPLDSTGASVKLNHGHSYILQEEFSNLINGCSYK